jgi:hypothetical protein
LHLIVVPEFEKARAAIRQAHVMQWHCLERLGVVHRRLRPFTCATQSVQHKHNHAAPEHKTTFGERRVSFRLLRFGDRRWLKNRRRLHVPRAHATACN